MVGKLLAAEDAMMLQYCGAVQVRAKGRKGKEGRKGMQLQLQLQRVN